MSGHRLLHFQGLSVTREEKLYTFEQSKRKYQSSHFSISTSSVIAAHRSWGKPPIACCSSRTHAILCELHETREGLGLVLAVQMNTAVEVATRTKESSWQGLGVEPHFEFR